MVISNSVIFASAGSAGGWLRIRIDIRNRAVNALTVMGTLAATDGDVPRRGTTVAASRCGYRSAAVWLFATGPDCTHYRWAMSEFCPTEEATIIVK
jgi:hypothetical protein